MKILLVEDNNNTLTVLQDVLTIAGHSVLAASEGEQGLDLFAAEHPDLVLLDVQLPGLNGYQIAQRIRADGGDDWVPIIFLSGEGSDEAINRGIEAGGDDYLVKPISQVVLLAKLRAMERIAAMRQRLLRLSSQLTQANEKLQWIAQHDALTGLANRRLFDEYLAQEWYRQRRHHHPLSLLLIDVDNFKAYNDYYGHQRGDDCLRKIAALLQQGVRRSSDLVARYGGEEFVVVLPMLRRSEARELAERLRSSVLKAQLEHRALGATGYVTISIGVASVVPCASLIPADLIAGADRALYRAKCSGKNRVEYILPKSIKRVSNAAQT